MPCRAGITTRLQERRQEWQRKYRHMRNWKAEGPFQSRADAQAWEDRQPCEKSGGGADPDSPGARWYGYRFYY